MSDEINFILFGVILLIFTINPLLLTLAMTPTPEALRL